MSKKLVFVCSPLSGEFHRNREKAQMFCRMLCVTCKVVAMAPHVYFTRFLDDDSPDERRLGIELGKEWLRLCGEVWVFGGRISSGMAEELTLALQLGKKIVCFDDITQEAFDVWMAEKKAREGNRRVARCPLLEPVKCLWSAFKTHGLFGRRRR